MLPLQAVAIAVGCPPELDGKTINIAEDHKDMENQLGTDHEASSLLACSYRNVLCKALSGG